MDYLRFFLALVFVLGLIGILAVLARRTGLGFPLTAIKSIQKRRLSVVEVTAIDGRRRMVLIRRDNIEHLLLISPSSEMLIETNITPDPAITSDPAEIEVKPSTKKYQAPNL